MLWLANHARCDQVIDMRCDRMTPSGRRGCESPASAHPPPGKSASLVPHIQARTSRVQEILGTLPGTLGMLAVSACARCVVPEMLANSLISIWLMITTHPSPDDHSSSIPPPPQAPPGIDQTYNPTTATARVEHDSRVWRLAGSARVWRRARWVGPAGPVLLTHK